MASELRISKLARTFDRNAFDCGVASLGSFLREHAVRHMEQNVDTTYVLHNRGETGILGYYTISMSHIDLHHLPEKRRKQLPRHPVPAAIIGRLAVSTAHQGKHYGMYLLVDAVRRITRLSEEIGVHAIEVDAIDERARECYQRFGFIGLEDDINHLYLPMSTVIAAFDGLL